jgi:hypothetical protein
MPQEMQADNLIFRLDGRVVEVMATNSSWGNRTHVDAFAVMAKDPDRHGNIKIKIGRLIDGDFLNEGAAATLTPEEFARFERFHALAKAARDAGPEPW